MAEWLAWKAARQDLELGDRLEDLPSASFPSFCLSDLGEVTRESS
jgi:hypothetical protein